MQKGSKANQKKKYQRSDILVRRIKNVQTLLKQEPTPAALLLSSALPVTRTWDQHYPFRQNSDFYYLTGSKIQDTFLLVLPDKKSPFLFTPPKNPLTILWEGAPPNIEEISESIEAEVIVTENPEKELLSRLRGINVLYAPHQEGTGSWKFIQQRQLTPSFRSYDHPRSFPSSDLLLENLRLIKDPTEVTAIRDSARVTIESMRDAIPLIRPGSSEREIAALIEYGFRRRGGEPAFEAIVGTGRSAATLHYSALTKQLKAKDMVLVDCGAEVELYAADITRVFPVSGAFSKIDAIIYDAVLEAQKAAINEIKDGAQLRNIYCAATMEMIEGLRRLKVLKGNSKKLYETKAFAPYFPHGIGHSLGIDVHDVGNLRGRTEGIVRAGMILTVEPGLYFSKSVGLASPCGVRIEDDVLVTSTGCKVLTSGIPKEREEVENLFRTSPSF